VKGQEKGGDMLNMNQTQANRHSKGKKKGGPTPKRGPAETGQWGRNSDMQGGKEENSRCPRTMCGSFERSPQNKRGGNLMHIM